jgi:hypothetical protein
MIFNMTRRAVIRHAVSALAVVQCRAVRGLVLGATAGCQVLLWKLDAMLQASTGKPKDTGGMVRAQTVSAVVLVTAGRPHQRQYSQFEMGLTTLIHSLHVVQVDDLHISGCRALLWEARGSMQQRPLLHLLRCLYTPRNCLSSKQLPSVCGWSRET